MPSEKHALVAGELDDPVDLAGGVRVPDERPSRVDLAISARGVAAADVDDVVVARLQEEGLGLLANVGRVAAVAGGGRPSRGTGAA
jgi:hypothetical protein